MRSNLAAALGATLIVGATLVSVGCGGQASRRLGEVYTYKAVPRDAVLTSDRSRAVYMLRGPGYPASENANRLFDLFNEFGHIGPLVLLEEASRLGEEADRSYRLAVDRGEANSPTTKSLSEIALQSWAIASQLRGQIQIDELERLIRELEKDPDDAIKADRLAHLKAEIERLPKQHRRERELTATIGGLLWTRIAMRTLSNDLKDLYNELYRDNHWIPWSARTEFLGTKYPLHLTVGGLPLPNDTWTYMAKPGGDWTGDWTRIMVAGKRTGEQSRPKFVIDPTFVDYLGSALPPSPRRTNAGTNWREARSYGPVRAEQDTEANRKLERVYTQLATELHDVAERVLSVRDGLQYQWERLPRISYEREGLSAEMGHLVEAERLSLDTSALFHPPAAAGDEGNADADAKGGATSAARDEQRDLRVIETMAYKRMINEVQIRIRNSIDLINRVLRIHADEMADLARDHVDAKIQLEALARRFDRLVPRHPNRKLAVVDDPKLPPTRLTVLLKTLYIRYLSEGSPSIPPERRGTELLVTAEMQTADDVNAGNGQVSPVVFEPHYAPGMFVNVRDRIVYGPRTYTGQFFNVRLSVVELDGLANSAISNGLSMAMDAVTSFQPELGVVSPFVTSFFRGVLNAVTEDDVELKFEFTLPSPEGKGKADVDLLLAETGHYIILKRENPEREEYNALRANRRYTDNDLIYNPENGLLYYRKDMENPQNNFVPENLFREQTYMVLVVTDEYASEDRLGEALRQRLSTALGEERARELIPDRDTTLAVLQGLGQLSEGALPGGAALSDADRHARSQEVELRQEELWSSSSDFSKAAVIHALSEAATDRAKQALGTDLEAWKQAALVVRADGLIDVE